MIVADMADGGNVERIARAFVDARRSGSGLPTYPGDAPATLGEAYAIQDAAIALQSEPVAGWKVGKIPAPLDSVHGANRLAGPIFASSVVIGGPADMPIIANGFAAAEAEFLLRIGSAPERGKSDYTINQASALIDAVHVGIEIASSPYPGINADGPTVTVSDFGNNYGLLVGAAIDDWRSAGLEDWPVELRINDAVIGAAKARDMLDGPFGAAAFLFNLMAHRGIELVPGQWISSGAVTGVHEVAVGDQVEARFAERTVRCSVVAR
jgi:2-keto-4-pentenoate hydratase